MASIHPYKITLADGSQKTRFRIRYREKGALLSKSFETKMEAEAFQKLLPEDGRKTFDKFLDKKIDQLLAKREELKQVLPLRPDGKPKTTCSQARDMFIKSRAEGMNGAPPAAEGTVRNYTYWLGKFATFFANRYVEDITKEDARAFRAYCDDSKHGKRANIGIYSTTITLWNFLIGMDIVEANVFQEAVSKLKLKTKARHKAAADMDKRCYGFDEAYAVWKLSDRLWNAGEPADRITKVGWRTAVMLKLLIATGMRRSEICGMKLDCFDPDRRMIVVRSTVLSRGEVSTVKSRTSARTIFVHPLISDALKEWIEVRRAQFLRSGATSDFIFCDMMGDVLAGNNWHQVFLRTLASANISARTQHGFRHMVTSVLVNLKVDDLTIIRTLGHDNVSFTREHYAHLMKQNGDPEARRFIQEVCAATAGLNPDKIRTLAA